MSNLFLKYNISEKDLYALGLIETKKNQRKDDTRNVFIFYYVEENIDLGPWARVASGLRMAGPASPLAGLTKSFGEAMADGWPSH